MDFRLLESLAPWVAAAAGASAALYVIFGPRSPEGERAVARGLQNLGNTCYMNAVLQAVASSSHFVSWMTRTSQSVPSNLKEYMPMTDSVDQVMRALSSRDTDQVHCPAEMIRALTSHGWRTGGEEQDAHELFHIMVMALTHELEMWCQPLSPLDVRIALLLPVREVPRGVAMARRLETALPLRFGTAGNPLNGLLATHMTCLTCGHRRPPQFSHFDCLSLLLPRRYWSTGSTVPLAHLLAEFCRAEPLEGVECDSCTARDRSTLLPSSSSDSAKSRSNFRKEVAVARMPDCLCFQVQRLYWMNNGAPWKSQTRVECPEILDMAPYTVPIFASRLQQHVQRRHSAAQMYRLKSIVVHQGGSGGGHYVTYRCGVDDHSRWVCISDASVREVSCSDVKVCLAYMVFYEKVTVSM